LADLKGRGAPNLKLEVVLRVDLSTEGTHSFSTLIQNVQHMFLKEKKISLILAALPVENVTIIVVGCAYVQVSRRVQIDNFGRFTGSAAEGGCCERSWPRVLALVGGMAAACMYARFKLMDPVNGDGARSRRSACPSLGQLVVVRRVRTPGRST
jgi:hypothetical protein